MKKPFTASQIAEAYLFEYNYRCGHQYRYEFMCAKRMISIFVKILPDLDSRMQRKVEDAIIHIQDKRLRRSAA